MHPLLVGVHYITLTVHSCMFIEIENLTPLLLFSQRNQSSQKVTKFHRKVILFFIIIPIQKKTFNGKKCQRNKWGKHFDNVVWHETRSHKKTTCKEKGTKEGMGVCIIVMQAKLDLLLFFRIFNAPTNQPPYVKVCHSIYIFLAFYYIFLCMWSPFLLCVNKIGEGIIIITFHIIIPFH